MIDFTTYKNYWEGIKSRIPEIKSVLTVATEHHLSKSIKDISEFPLLVAVIPSADPVSRDIDNVKEMNTALIFVLTKLAESDTTDETYTAAMQQTQEAMKLVKNTIAADFADCDSAYHNVMERLDVNSFHQDPEYNYLGCNGWSLSFKFKSIGY